jgi:3-hydroxy-9,10-secoandrosta-1,3,5(10)-triene-9,17-dione monooxygenase
VDALIASSFVFPAGKARKVTDGYLLSGRWPFSSGVDPSEWNMLAGLARLDDNLPPEQRIFMVPRAQYQVIDTWRAGGLRGTGSNDVEVSEVFVPEHRTLAVADTKGGPTPGSAVNPGILFRLPVFALFPYMLSGVALGIAEGLIEDYKPAAGKMTGARVAEIQSTQIRLAEATAYARASRVIQLANCREAEQNLPDMKTKARYRLEGAYAVEWAACTARAACTNPARSRARSATRTPSSSTSPSTPTLPAPPTAGWRWASRAITPRCRGICIRRSLFCV